MDVTPPGMTIEVRTLRRKAYSPIEVRLLGSLIEVWLGLRLWLWLGLGLPLGVELGLGLALTLKLNPNLTLSLTRIEGGLVGVGSVE